MGPALGECGCGVATVRQQAGKRMPARGRNAPGESGDSAIVDRSVSKQIASGQRIRAIDIVDLAVEIVPNRAHGIGFAE